MKPPGPVSRITASSLAALTRIVTGATMRWLGEPPTVDQRVYFANHTSHMDFLVLWASLPQSVRELTHPVAAADYWSSGLKSKLAAHVFRAVLVNRRGPPSLTQQETPESKLEQHMAAVRPLLEVLAAGESLVLFPEGTRGDGSEVAPFKSGLFTLCETIPGLKLVPVYLENLSRMLPKGEILPIPLICKLTFGPTIELQHHEERKHFLARARSALCDLRDE